MGDPVHVSKLLRIDAALDALREACEAELDDAAVARLDVAARALLVEAGSALPEPLLEELGELVRPFQHPNRTPDEIRLAIAQLCGWLHGLERAVSA